MTEPQYPPERTAQLADEGATTQDLGRRATGRAARPVPAPAGEWFDRPTAEVHIRTRGKWMIISGAAITLLTAALAIVWDAGHDEMPLAVIVPLQALGLGGVTMGCLEYLARPHRSAQQRCLDRINQVELAVLELVGLMDEDKQQAFYNGAAWQVRNDYISGTGTGTENARPLNKYRTEGVVPFRQRNRG
jgi:hypothetical protein